MLMQVLKLPVRWLVSLLFRVRVIGLEHYHAAGERVLIVANHVSLLDGILIYLYFPERPTFAINTLMARKAAFQPFLWFVDLFALDPTNPLSLKSIIHHLRNGNKAVIFPEGRITVTGSPMKVYDGPGMIADHADATILPVGIEGAQYSRFSYLKGKMRIRWFPRITLRFLPPEKLDLPAGLHGTARRRAAAARMGDIMERIAFANCNFDTTVINGVVEAMERHGPGQLIVEDTSRQPLSYRQLITRAFILGSVIARDTRRGERVGLLLPNVSATLVALLACHTRGRVPAMLNFTAGPQGLVTACETASIRTVYTSRRFIEEGGFTQVAETLAGVVRLVYLEDLRTRVSAARKLRGLLAGRLPRLALWLHNRRSRPEDAAVVLFTSGSEGVPKGVVLTHRNLLANRAQFQMLLDLTPRDVLFNAMPLFHSFGLTGGVMLPLLDGARVFLYPSPLHYRLIPELCYELGASVLFGTNTFLAGYARYAHPYDFYSMRYVVAGAEKLQEETRRLWAERFGIRVFEGYGATEASPVISVNTPMHNRTGTVGRLLTGIEHYLEPVEGLEEGGRLVIRGPNVMKGYLFHGADEIAPPWTEARGAGWYDTDDVVTVDEDGFVSIIGRVKRFAKLGGEMVSLAAVEELASRAWPDAVHAAVTLSDARKGEQIVLLTEQADAERKRLVEAARRGGYSELMVPRRVVPVESVPLLGSGKIDYRAAGILAAERAQ